MNDISERLDREASRIDASGLRPEHVIQRAERRERRKRVLAAVVGMAGLVGVLLILQRLSPQADVPTDARTNSVPAPTPGGCDLGPWAEVCPEAEWARQVVTAAGYELIGDTGAALVLRGPGGRDVYFWAIDPDLHSGGQPFSDLIDANHARPVDLIDGTSVYSVNGRLVWTRSGLIVWLDFAIAPDFPDAADPTLVSRLVEASGAIPYSANPPE